MVDRQQSVKPDRFNSVKHKLDSLASAVQGIRDELHEQSDVLHKEVLELAQKLEDEAQSKQELAVQLESVAGQRQRLKEEAQRLQQDLANESEKAGLLLEQLGDTERDKQQLNRELELARKRNEALSAQVESAESKRESLESGKRQLRNSLGKLQREFKRKRLRYKELEDRLVSEIQNTESLRLQIGACRSDREVLTLEISQIEARAQRAKLEVGKRFAKELSPLLADLSDLSGLEPEAVRGLKPRSVMEKLKSWMESTVGECLIPFPSKDGLSEANALYLDPDETGIEALMRMYDWQPDHPFEGMAIGERRCRFRVLHRGWRLGAETFVRARVVVESGSEEERVSSTPSSD